MQFYAGSRRYIFGDDFETKPCPFCGKLPTLWKYKPRRPDGSITSTFYFWLAECSNEDCPMHGQEAMYVDVWNKRPEDYK